MKYVKMTIGLLAVLMIGSTLYAAPLTQAFRNDYATDSIFLFITAGDVEFENVIRMPVYWDMGISDPYTLALFGFEIDPGEKFIIRFSERGSFTLEWAEMLGSVIQGSGSIFFENGRYVDASAEFDQPVPTPVMPTLWLLGSGLVCLVGVRRKLKP